MTDSFIVGYFKKIRVIKNRGFFKSEFSLDLSIKILLFYLPKSVSNAISYSAVGF